MKSPVFVDHPPMGWQIAFPTEKFSPKDRKAMLVEELVRFFLSDSEAVGLFSRWYRQHDHIILHIDFVGLEESLASEDFTLAMRYQPAEALLCLSVAAYELLFCPSLSPESSSLASAAREGPPRYGRIIVRLSNHSGSKIGLRDLRSSIANQLVTVKATVVKAGPVHPQAYGMEFRCLKCDAVQWCRFPDFHLVMPTKCGKGGCRGRAFTPVKDTAACVDWQLLRVQELRAPEDTAAQLDESVGRVPRTIQVEMGADLAGMCRTGDTVEVTGILKLHKDHSVAKRAEGPSKGRAQQQSGVYTYYIEAVGARVLGRTGQHDFLEETERALCSLPGPGTGDLPGVPDFTFCELDFVCTYQEECRGEYLKQLVRAFCPHIYGNTAIKAGILLALFGGVHKQLGRDTAHRDGGVPEDEQVPLRGDIHVLLVGDPGLGKSQMLKAACDAAPRGLYVCGNSSTSAGLTVSVKKEAGKDGEFTFEAGAAVLADRGVLCVDEFDKMRADHGALLEVMEQQEVSMAKAGMVASLPARATVVAAANPTKGHYDPSKDVSQNLRMSPAMLSRFDLIFVMEDRSDNRADSKLSDHVLAVHSRDPSRLLAARSSIVAPLLLDGPKASQPGVGSVRPTLEDRLALTKDDVEIDPLPMELLRRLVAYARAYITPVLSDEAGRELRDFWLSLRHAGMGASGLPVTMRQLDGLVRLSEARARMELSNVVTREHALDVVDVVRSSVIGSVGCPGAASKKRRRRGKAAEMERLLEGICMLGRRARKDTFEASEIFDLADRMQVQGDLPGILHALNEAGELLKRGPSLYACPAARAHEV